MEPIQPELRDLLTNLVIERNSPTNWRPSGAELAFLSRELEAAVIDKAALQSIIKFLGTLSIESVENSSSLVESDEDLEAILSGGFGALIARSESLFFKMAIDPFALMELRDIVLGELPPYWWDLIRHAGDHEPRTAEQIWKAAKTGAKAESLAASFDHLSMFEAKSGPKRWGVTASADQVSRILPEGGALPEVVIEFTLTPEHEEWRLEVDVLDPPPVLESIRTGRLIGLSGNKVVDGEDVDGILTFKVNQSELAAGLELEGDYRRGDSEYIRFRIPILFE